jgi:hypothetical protein
LSFDCPQKAWKEALLKKATQQLEADSPLPRYMRGQVRRLELELRRSLGLPRAESWPGQDEVAAE